MTSLQELTLSVVHDPELRAGASEVASHLRWSGPAPFLPATVAGVGGAPAPTERNVEEKAEEDPAGMYSRLERLLDVAELDVQCWAARGLSDTTRVWFPTVLVECHRRALCAAIRVQEARLLDEAEEVDVATLGSARDAELGAPPAYISEVLPAALQL